MEASMTKPIVQLWTLEGEDYFGLIIPCASGVEWTNQVGGNLCAHPKVEGIYIPLPTGWNPHFTPLIDDYRSYSPHLVQAFLEASPALLATFSPCSELDVHVRESCFSKLAEAWVPVRIRESDTSNPSAVNWMVAPLLEAFRGQSGILTYSNSD